jgi:hypothetical protein
MRAPKSITLDVEANNAIYKEVVIIGKGVNFRFY